MSNIIAFPTPAERAQRDLDNATTSGAMAVVIRIAFESQDGAARVDAAEWLRAYYGVKLAAK